MPHNDMFNSVPNNFYTAPYQFFNSSQGGPAPIINANMNFNHLDGQFIHSNVNAAVKGKRNVFNNKK